MVTAPTAIATGAPEPVLLWSASCRLKFDIQERYYGTHYCWCSPAFEAAALDPFAVGARMPPSSDPVTIYRTLHAAVRGQDRHDPKITGWKSSIRALAVKQAQKGVITNEQAKEISMTVRSATFIDWRPIMYVIPYALVTSRIRRVPFSQAASREPEYVVSDLSRSEFHVIELMPCP